MTKLPKVFLDIPMVGEFEGKLFEIKIGARGRFPADIVWYASGENDFEAKWNLRKVIGFNNQEIKAMKEIKF